MVVRPAKSAWKEENAQLLAETTLVAQAKTVRTARQTVDYAVETDNATSVKHAQAVPKIADHVVGTELAILRMERTALPVHKIAENAAETANVMQNSEKIVLTVQAIAETAVIPQKELAETDNVILFMEKHAGTAGMTVADVMTLNHQYN